MASSSNTPCASTWPPKTRFASTSASTARRFAAHNNRYDEALHYFGQLTEEDHEPRVVVSFAYQGRPALLRELCKPHERTKVDRWAANPAALEEEDCLSKQLSVAKHHNAELAGPTYPARAALAAGKSFAAAADLLKTNRTLASLMKELSRGKAPAR